MKSLDIALLVTLATLLIFVSFVSVCNVKGIQIQDSLITTLLGILGGEIVSCGGIQIFKIKHRHKSVNSDKIGAEDVQNDN